jgi:hypothetical protein
MKESNPSDIGALLEEKVFRGTEKPAEPWTETQFSGFIKGKGYSPSEN